MKRYIYDGPVMMFGICVNPRWQGETVAATPAKAKSNLAYQYKRETRRAPDALVKLTGTVRAEE